MFKSIIITMTFMLASIAQAAAVSSENPCNENRQEDVKKGNDSKRRDDFRKWMEEMDKYKQEFLSKELSLTAEQKEQFFQLYKSMENEKRKMANDVRKMRKDVERKGDAATDLELEKAADAEVELAGKQNEVDRRFHSEFKNILTKRQLFKLSQAERKFQKSLMDHRGKNKK